MKKGFFIFFNKSLKRMLRPALKSKFLLKFGFIEHFADFLILDVTVINKEFFAFRKLLGMSKKKGTVVNWV